MRSSQLIRCLGLAAFTAAVAGQNCSTVSFDTPATAQNFVFTNPPDPNNEAALINFMLEAFRGTPPPNSGTTAVSGTFTIVGT